LCSLEATARQDEVKFLCFYHKNLTRHFFAAHKNKEMATCVICDEAYTGPGNNALPVKSGLCCNSCDNYYVLPERIENAEIKALVESRPYPDFDVMTKLLLSSAQFKVAGQHMGFIWYAEYSEENHQCCKRIYESCLDPAVCKEMGKKINAAGGKPAMQACFYILLHYSKSYGFKRLEGLWDGIGEWLS
jgi:hypothetical protein